MASYTTNYDLKKPSPDEFYDVKDFNENWDKLDKAIGEKSDKEYVDNVIEGIDIDVPVTSVNEKTGDVELGANDVGAVTTTRKVNGKELSEDIALNKADVGLGSVQNYGIATTTQAQAGTANNLYMTPALVKAAVEYMSKNGGISMVKSVQRGLFSKTLSTSEYHDVLISSVNTSKSFISLSTLYAMGAGSHMYNNLHASLKNSTTLRFTCDSSQRWDSSTNGSVAWEVIEFY
ncbi:MAG: hypothetical protein GX366_07365 [Epulopiscium sp.]|nr:hypothetical protein [Candidatus Epulonipiscium sp.]